MHFFAEFSAPVFNNEHAEASVSGVASRLRDTDRTRQSADDERINPRIVEDLARRFWGPDNQIMPAV